MVGAINRDHTDHTKDMKDEESVAGLGMEVPNNEGIVLVAAVDAVPTICQIDGLRTYS